MKQEFFIMKKTVLSFAAIVSLFTLSAGSFTADFEDQDVSKWMPFQKGETISVSDQEPGSGKYSLQILSAGMKLKKSAFIPVVQGEKYTVSVNMRCSGKRVRMSFAEFDKAGEWLRGSTFYAAETRSRKWITLKNTWTPRNPKAAFIVIQFDGDGFADDIKFNKLAK